MKYKLALEGLESEFTILRSKTMENLRMLCCDYESIRPDIVCLGKALSGGMYPVRL